MPDDAIERARDVEERTMICVNDIHALATQLATGSIMPAMFRRKTFARLLAFASQQAPEGWRLVPIVPTDAMIDAAGGASISLERADDPSYEPAEVWSAMLDAAPSVTLGEVG